MVPVRMPPGEMLPLNFTSLAATASAAAKICPSVRAFSAAPRASVCFKLAVAFGAAWTAALAAAAAMPALDRNVAEEMKLLYPGEGLKALVPADCNTRLAA